MAEIATKISEFGSVFNAIMSFITGNPYLMVMLGAILFLGLAGAALSLFRG